jgi:hypothetical protein
MQEADAHTQYPLIQYPFLASKLFDDRQWLVPFLGAGASTSEADPPKPEPLSAPEQDIIDTVCTQLSLAGAAKDFLETAIRVAWEMQQRAAKSAAAQVSPFEAVRRSDWPPSAEELASALAHNARYDHFSRKAEWFGERLPHGGPAGLAAIFKWAATVTGLASSAPPLLSVASYCSYTQDSEAVWLQLKTLFQNKTKPTIVHRMVACMARYYLDRVFAAEAAAVGTEPNMALPPKDYLIVTTNYDCLVEQALKLAAVPYCVLAVAKSDGLVDATPSEGLQDYLAMANKDFGFFLDQFHKPPGSCEPSPHRPIVIVYKIHGCLYPLQKDRDSAIRDSVILTDEDYIDYMRKNGPQNSQIPNAARNLMAKKGFLFMGYSFSDWNVRSWYTSLAEDPNMRTKKPPPDYAVMKDLDPYQAGFFDKKNNINILLTKLDRFAKSVMDEAPPKARACGAWQ